MHQRTCLHAENGKAVTDLSLAINSTFVNKAGERKDEVCYVDIVTWGRQAETAAEYLTKGSPIFVEGRLQLDSWETGEGEKRSKIRVRANRIQFLGRGQAGATRPGTEGTDGHHVQPDGGIEEASMPEEGKDGDVPF
ncbi:MAG: single-stranded DNA-binding protein [bacterium]